MHCPIPGSYALEAVATIKTKDQRVRRFSMARIKSHDQQLLCETLARFGWECLQPLPIGPRNTPAGDAADETGRGWTGDA